MKDLLTPKYILRFVIIVGGLFLLTKSISVSLAVLFLLLAIDRIFVLWMKTKMNKNSTTDQEDE